MRVTRDYLALQLTYDKQLASILLVPELLTTARFETIHREMLPYGTLDLVFEGNGEIFVVHAIGIEVVALARREGPAFVWPASFEVEPPLADALEDVVTPWLWTLTRGRAMAGEHIRKYRSSAVFSAARERRFYGAATSVHSLQAMAPFVFARRFARNRSVFIDCKEGAFAAAVVGTVARSILLARNCDDLERRWYGQPAQPQDGLDPQVAIIDDWDTSYPQSAKYVVATRVHPAAVAIVVPAPVPNDLLFTYDAADAPQADAFGVRAPDRVERMVRNSSIAAACGGSSGRIALVVRSDASFAGDADTDAVAELAQRLRGEGLEANIVSPTDDRIGVSDIVHIFGAVGDEHVAVAACAARDACRPFIVTLEPIAPYATFYEDTLIAALCLAVDEAELEYYLDLSYSGRLLFDGLEKAISVEAADERDRSFEDACRSALGVILAPGEDAAAFTRRFPRLDVLPLTNVPVLLAREPKETPIAHLLPAEPFLLLHGPLTRRSTFAHILTSLAKASFRVVVAGPVSDVSCAATLRRVAAADVVFIPDPTEAEVAALYRRAHAVAIPTLRPSGVGRLMRAALCGAATVVPVVSPLARLVPPAALFNAQSRADTAQILHNVMRTSYSEIARGVREIIWPLSDQRIAFNAIVELYSRAAVPIA